MNVWNALPFPPVVGRGIASLAKVNERIEELGAEGKAVRFISDIVLHDSYTRVMDVM
jgi:hypothetical protein